MWHTMAACNAETKRSKNFSDREISLLLDIITSFLNVIENKRTDNMSCRVKNAAWENITHEYNNSIEQAPIRTVRQLKNCYENFKKKTRREYAEFKVNNKNNYLNKKGITQNGERLLKLLATCRKNSDGETSGSNTAHDEALFIMEDDSVSFQPELSIKLEQSDEEEREYDEIPYKLITDIRTRNNSQQEHFPWRKYEDYNYGRKINARELKEMREVEDFNCRRNVSCLAEIRDVQDMQSNGTRDSRNSDKADSAELRGIRDQSSENKRRHESCCRSSENGSPIENHQKPNSSVEDMRIVDECSGEEKNNSSSDDSSEAICTEQTEEEINSGKKCLKTLITSSRMVNKSPIIVKSAADINSSICKSHLKVIKDDQNKNGSINEESHENNKYSNVVAGEMTEDIIATKKLVYKNTYDQNRNENTEYCKNGDKDNLHVKVVNNINNNCNKDVTENEEFRRKSNKLIPKKINEMDDNIDGSHSEAEEDNIEGHDINPSRIVNKVILEENTNTISLIKNTKTNSKHDLNSKLRSDEENADKTSLLQNLMRNKNARYSCNQSSLADFKIIDEKCNKSSIIVRRKTTEENRRCFNKSPSASLSSLENISCELTDESHKKATTVQLNNAIENNTNIINKKISMNDNVENRLKRRKIVNDDHKRNDSFVYNEENAFNAIPAGKTPNKPSTINKNCEENLNNRSRSFCTNDDYDDESPFRNKFHNHDKFPTNPNKSSKVNRPTLKNIPSIELTENDRTRMQDFYDNMNEVLCSKKRKCAEEENFAKRRRDILLEIEEVNLKNALIQTKILENNLRVSELEVKIKERTLRDLEKSDQR